MKLFKVHSDEFIVSHKDKSHKFNLNQTIAFMLSWGVDQEEIILGMTELDKNNHQLAEYGIGLTGNGPKFIFTKRVG